MNYANVIRYAMEMEMNGYNFFKSNAEKMNNPGSKALFLQLAEVEKEHYEYLERQLDHYMEEDELDTSPEVFDREENIFVDRADSENLEAGVVESMVPDLTILRMAYLIERDFKEFYTDAYEKAEDEDVKALFKRLATWEEGHEKIFKKEYDKRMEEYMNTPWGG